jgi:hypothetical protein
MLPPRKRASCAMASTRVASTSISRSPFTVSSTWFCPSRQVWAHARDGKWFQATGFRQRCKSRGWIKNLAESGHLIWQRRAAIL